jgi:hypothetical protein
MAYMSSMFFWFSFASFVGDPSRWLNHAIALACAGANLAIWPDRANSHEKTHSFAS